ncbi:STAS domain-containing protein [Virgibacillus sp. W0181]|uniref:STAS domain-containing protein n=1 Tax=Virgibacillus sp. W0181 TaxID=3391581 RepID=UPI003F47C504
MNLTIDIVDDSDRSLVNLSGELDVYTAPQLKETLLPITTKEKHFVEVNLAEITYMDSTGLGIFISALKNTKEHNGHLKLINPQERVARLFRITGLNEIMDLQDTVQGGKEQ